MALHIIDHPLVLHKLSIMRDKNTSTMKFRGLLEEIAMLMGYEITRDLPLENIKIETPLVPMVAKTVSGKKLAIVPILRAGLGMVDGLLRLVPVAKVGHIGMYRDETTLKPVWYYNKVPMPVDRPTSDYYVYITDPMLATGNSLVEAIRLYVEKGIPETNICCVCMISSPQGIEKVFTEFPAITLIVAAVDSHLNERGYIVPGMGDAGDRIYNT